jgi:hypothetical protein
VAPPDDARRPAAVQDGQQAPANSPPAAVSARGRPASTVRTENSTTPPCKDTLKRSTRLRRDQRPSVAGLCRQPPNASRMHRPHRSPDLPGLSMRSEVATARYLPAWWAIKSVCGRAQSPWR